nr:sulfurtransferase [Kineosporia mesophila]
MPTFPERHRPVSSSLLPPLASAPEVHAVLGDPRLRIVDATGYLDRPAGGGPYTVRSGRLGYEEEHLPGAGFADIGGDLSVAGAPRPFTLPEPEALAATFGAIGLGSGTHVVIYARNSPMWATRLWWLLHYLGHDDVSVLDGGLPGWKAAGLPVESGPVRFPTAVLEPRPRHDLLATQTQVQELSENAGCLVNALTPAVFRGEGVTSYSRPGRIPGSVNLPWTELVDGQTLVWRDAQTRAAALEPHQDRPVVAYCGGGISATVDVFGWYLAGRDDVRLYDGSLAEWSAQPDLPLQLG